MNHMENEDGVKTVKPDNSSVQAVDRALLLLNLVSESDEPVSIVDLTEKSAMNRTTVWRLIGTLENHGFIDRDPVTKNYMLGYAATRLAARSPQYSSLIRRARQCMEQLRDATQETVLLSVPKHYGTLTIDQIDPSHSVRLIDYIHAFLPLHSTSNGKLLLSTYSEEELAFLLDQPLIGQTPHTITDSNKLRKEIAKVKALGYATAIGELDENENGISVPVYDTRGQLVAFLSVCGPNFRFTEAKMQACTDQLLTAAKDIANRL